jgi:cell division protein FtsW (lipid II flippase)
VLTRVRQLDKALVVSVVALALFGLATLYSDGQTDVPTFVAAIWQRQVVWLGLGLIVAWLTFRTSPRMLEWATPFVYGIAVFLLVLSRFSFSCCSGRAPSPRCSCLPPHP